MKFTEKDLKESLVELGLNHKELAGFIGIDETSVSRWLRKIHKIPVGIGPLLQTWVRLKREGLHWRPDCPQCDEEPEEKLIFNVSLELMLGGKISFSDVDKIISEKIYKGRKHFWDVNREKGFAQYNNVRVDFKNLSDKKFEPRHYQGEQKKNEDISSVIDKELLADAIYAYYEADPYDRFPRREEKKEVNKEKKKENKDEV